jgi:MATE family multidrug resistance protein
MGVVDVAMTGHASAEDLAIVSLGTSVWSIVIVTVMGVMMSINTLVAHAIGAGAFDQVAHLVRQALWKSLLIGAVACVGSVLGAQVFNSLELDTGLRDDAINFVYIISLGLPAFTAYRALYGYSASLGQTKPSMLIALGGLAYNVVANWLLVFGNLGFPRLGGLGCAIATASGLWLMLIALVVWIRLAPAFRATYPFDRYETPQWATIRDMLKLGAPIGVTYFAEVTAFASVALFIAKFGAVTIAANQIAFNFSSLVFMVPMSFGIALVTRVGQALGGGEPREARFIAWAGVALSLCYALVSAISLVLLRDAIAAGYTSDLAVQELAAELLLLAAIFQFSDAAQVSAASAIRGYKVTRRPMLVHLTAFWGMSLPLGYVLGLAPSWLPWAPATPMGAQGFWIGLVAGLTVAAVLLCWLLNKLSQESLHAEPA